jgi:hypothetical protein
LRSDRVFNFLSNGDRPEFSSGIDPLLLSDYVAIAVLILNQLAIALEFIFSANRSNI